MVAEGTGKVETGSAATGVGVGVGVAGVGTGVAGVGADAGDGAVWALEMEPNPCAAATPAPTCSPSSRQRSGRVETRLEVMARDFIAARANLLCCVARGVSSSTAATHIIDSKSLRLWRPE
jgi:hypothetical protein